MASVVRDWFCSDEISEVKRTRKSQLLAPLKLIPKKMDCCTVRAACMVVVGGITYEIMIEIRCKNYFCHRMESG